MIVANEQIEKHRISLQSSKMSIQSHSGETTRIKKGDIDISIWVQRDRYGNLFRVTHYFLRNDKMAETAEKLK